MSGRFVSQEQGEEFENEYDLPTSETMDVQNRGIGPVRVVNEGSINLGSALTLDLSEIGYGFALYVQNKSTGKIIEEALINVYVNAGDGSDPTRAFPCKCGRGYVGAFQRLYLSWPAHTGGPFSVNFVVFKSKLYPWIGGEEAE